MRNPKIITLCVIACMLILSACSNASDNQGKMVEKASDIESIQLKLDRNDITVEVGEIFKVKAIPLTVEGELEGNIMWNFTEWQQIISYNNREWMSGKGFDVKDGNPYEGTEFRADEPGITKIAVTDFQGNVLSDTCTVTVVEKEGAIEEETDEKTQDKNESTQGVLYSKGGTTILLKNTLPFTVNYKFGDKLYSSCEILNVSVGDISFMGIGIDIEYKKTFDSDGMGGQCTFWWKLYDSSNTVIEDGPVSQYNASVGEKFKDSFRILEDLGVETYTLEFVDYH